MSDIWQQEKNLTKAARILGESKSQLHSRESSAKTKVKRACEIEFSFEKIKNIFYIHLRLNSATNFKLKID